MHNFSIVLVATLALAASTFAIQGGAAAAGKKNSAVDVQVSSKVDVDPQGFPYYPIYCGHVGQCRCKGGGGYAQCSWCPDDKGSSHKYSNVCWCKNVFHQYGRNECNPLKAGGPQELGDWDHTGTEYRPLRCHRRSQCGCHGIGTPHCSRCPDDGGSKNKYNSVCWCQGINRNHYGQRSGNECNQRKPNGPYQKY